MSRRPGRCATILSSLGIVVLCVFGCGTRIGTDETAFAELAIEVIPVRALVLVDEMPVLRTQLSSRQSVAIEPGIHRVAVEAAGFRSYRTDIDVRGGEVLELNVELWPLVPEID